MTPEQAALKCKELWQVEHVFRDMKSLLDTRPVFHKMNETIRGHVFCSFLALVLRKELDRRLEKAGHCFEWADVKQDLKVLQQIIVEDAGRTLSVRTECPGICGKIFQAVGVAVLPQFGKCNDIPIILSKTSNRSGGPHPCFCFIRKTVLWIL